MLLFTACHVGVRLLGIALLAVVGPMVTAAVLGGDMLFFLLFKLARDDLRYWLKLDGVLSWVVSIVARFFYKLMVDFTVMVQLRHPQEIGGLYWIMCLVIGQATSFVALYLYSSVDAAKYKDNKLWALLGGIEAAFVLFFAAFVMTIKPIYRVTFFSTLTAKQFKHRRFRCATSDQAKIDIFGSHRSYYAGIRDEIEQWVREKYDAWVEEAPEWFTERVKTSIPTDLIPKEVEGNKHAFENAVRSSLKKVPPLSTGSKREEEGERGLRAQLFQ
jgi:hypothetical protein